MKYFDASELKFRKFEVSFTHYDKFREFPERWFSIKTGVESKIYKIIREVPLPENLKKSLNQEVVYIQDLGFENLISYMGCSIDSEEVEQFLKGF